ncbi:MAG: DUF3124 domain-containing protein [Polyangiales bacterium]
MGSDQKYPEWLLWFSEHGVRVLILLSIAFLAFVYSRSRSNTEQRLDAIQDSVQFEPPRSYTPPDLDAYAATDVTVQSLPVHQAAYVPVYSHIYYDGGRPYLLEATLSIRNIDPRRPVYVSAVEYYDTDGKLARKLVDRLIALGPLQSIDFLVERHDVAGGSGANFIVEWHAASRDANPPLIEAVMVGRSGTNAISFVRRSEQLPRWKATQ